MKIFIGKDNVPMNIFQDLLLETMERNRNNCSLFFNKNIVDENLRTENYNNGSTFLLLAKNFDLHLPYFQSGLLWQCY